MNRSGRHLLLFVVTSSLVACAGAEKRPAEEPRSTATPPPMQPGYPAQAAAPALAEESAKAPSGAAPYPDRSIAIAQATNDVASSQRQLDLSGGDCQNACRALGSMDRATGRLCGLAQSNDEIRRCDDARNRLYSARDKVRSSCGTCADVSVDRNAPVPSR